MKSGSLGAFLALAGSLLIAPGSADPGPLFLTPLILNGSIEEAKTKSRVQLFKDKTGATAYSGYITVNNTTNSNLFFLHILAAEEHSTAPLMLWTQGGPGLSALFGQFLQNGPLGVDAEGKLFKRNLTIQKHVNMLYLDVPVGSGFSFTGNDTAYASRLEDIIIAVKEFLRQFLCFFPEYMNRDLYVAGESYAGRYSIAIAHSLLTDPVLLNLKGIIAGVPFIAPVFDALNSTEFLYQVSMLTKDGRDKFATEFKIMKELAEINLTLALVRLTRTVFNEPRNPTLFEKLTLHSNQASALYSAMPLAVVRYVEYVSTPQFKNDVHVGEKAKFYVAEKEVSMSLFSDFGRNITKLLEYVLNKTSVLIYLAQMDTVFPAANQLAYLRTLNWVHALDYLNTKRVPWQPCGTYYGIAGYIKKVHQFTEALLFKAGHYASFDQPDEVYCLVKNFISNRNNDDIQNNKNQ